MEFPRIKAAPPADFGPLDRAVESLERFNWIIFAGSPCVKNFLDRLAAAGKDRSSFRRVRIGAIGHGAVSALKTEEIGIDYIPRIHTADQVIEGLGSVEDLSFLLVRVGGAPAELPDRLRRSGATITEAAGYRMEMTATKEMAEDAFGKQPDALALANPTAARYLVKAASRAGLDLKKALTGVPLAIVGPATAATAEHLGLQPTFVSKGHIADLADGLTRLLRR